MTIVNSVSAISNFELNNIGRTIIMGATRRTVTTFSGFLRSRVSVVVVARLVTGRVERRVGEGVNSDILPVVVRVPSGSKSSRKSSSRVGSLVEEIVKMRVIG